MPDATTPEHAPPDPALDQSMPEVPLLAEERAPLRPSLLDFNPARRHMENLDTLRILSMLVIILSHVTQPYLDRFSFHAPYSPLYQLVFSLNVAGRFGVPCFMMISFFIYWHQLYDKNRSWGELLYRRFKRLIPAFLCWSFFYVALHKVLSSRGLDVDPGPLNERLNWKTLWFWKEVLLLGHAHDHLYYLPVVMCSLLLIPLLAVLWPKPLRSWLWIGGTLVVWTFVIYGGAFFPETSRVGRLVTHTTWVWRNFLALPLLIFPLLGMMSAGQKAWRMFIAHSPTWLWVFLLVFGMALHVVETLFVLDKGTAEGAWLQALGGLKAGRFIPSVAIFVLILRHPLMKDPFPKVSHHAFGLHFMHPAIIIGLTLLEGRFFGRAVTQWQTLVVPMLILNYVLTFYITFALCLMISRFKRLEFLVV
jgi:surface polysaccharide O-acyltransferase-like enzyme